MKQLLFILGLLVNALAYGQNLIPNPDFEEGPDKSGYGWANTLENCSVSGSMDGPDRWYVVDGSPDRLVNGDITCDWSDMQAQSGQAYVDFVHGESGKAILAEPLEKGKQYRLSFWARWQTFQDAAKVPSGIRFEFSEEGNIIEPDPISNRDEWKYFEIEFTAEADSREIKIVGTRPHFGGVCLDNLSLIRLGEGRPNLPRAIDKRLYYDKQL